MFWITGYGRVDKVVVFKKAWHDSDTDPCAQDRWQKYLRVLYDTDEDLILVRASILLSAQILEHVDYHPETHPKMMKDAERACIAILLFTSRADAFFHGKLGSQHKASLLFNQAERAKHLPDRRGCQSSSYRNKSFYKEFDEVLREADCHNNPTTSGDLPLAWDICMRPKIAQCMASHHQLLLEGLTDISADFRHGIICAAYGKGVSGRAFAAKEEGRPLDLFIDYRDSVPETNAKKLVNPYDIKIESLREDARAFATRNPKARFALLRLWSAPHFYPFVSWPLQD